jgi:mRNA interferase RelE/StbE
LKAIVYSRDAARTLRRIPANIARMIIAKIEQYAADPSSLANNVTALKGQGGLIRLRVGDWRVIMSDGQVLAIEKIAPRGGAYT